MSPIINPDTSEAIDFGAIPEGVYKAKITKVEAGVSEKGNPKIVVYFDVEQAPHNIKERRSHLVTSGAGSMGFDQLLRATGFSEQADAYRDPAVANPDFDTDWLIGQELNVSIEPNFYKDKDGVPKKGDAISTFLRA